MMEAVTFPESHSFFACEMGPTKNRVLGREMVKGKGGEEGRKGGRGEEGGKEGGREGGREGGGYKC